MERIKEELCRNLNAKQKMYLVEIEKTYEKVGYEKSRLEAITSVSRKFERNFLSLLELEEVLQIFETLYDEFSESYIIHELILLKIDYDPFFVSAIQNYKQGGKIWEKVLRIFESLQGTEVGEKMKTYIAKSKRGK